MLKRTHKDLVGKLACAGGGGNRGHARGSKLSGFWFNFFPPPHHPLLHLKRHPQNHGN